MATRHSTAAKSGKPKDAGIAAGGQPLDALKSMEAALAAQGRTDAKLTAAIERAEARAKAPPEQSPPDSTALRGMIEGAIVALQRIARLADLTEDQLSHENVDGVIFVRYIAELCARHGRRLDAVYEHLSGGIRVGHFDHECYSEAAYD
jgi:hypothetical protein